MCPHFSLGAGSNMCPHFSPSIGQQGSSMSPHFSRAHAVTTNRDRRIAGRRALRNDCATIPRLSAEPYPSGSTDSAPKRMARYA